MNYTMVVLTPFRRNARRVSRNARRIFSPIRVPDSFEGIVSSDSARLKNIYTEGAFGLFNGTRKRV